MASELTIGLVIGASLKGVSAAFGEAKKQVQQLGVRTAIAQRQQMRLGRSISRAFSDPTRNVGALRQRYEQLGKAIQKAQKSQENLNKALTAQQHHTAKRRELQGKIFETGAHAMAGGSMVWSSVKTFMDQEEAANNLKIAMMKADGSIGAFEEIGKIASQLGTDLPGTKKDFYNLALALKKQGISDKVLTGGALKTSAELNVLLDMDQFEGGEFLAKFMESHGLSEAELGKSADYLQRAMYASGLSKAQMYESMKYYAPKLNSLGLTGADNTEKILAIEGIAGQQGLEGSTFGTGLNMMLSRMNKGPKMLAEAKKGMKAEARDMMKAAKVDFQFFDKKGSFKGIDGMLSEMEKFEKIRAKFGDEGVGLVAEELFGIEGGRLADILAKKGKQGLEGMLTKMREQASLQERIAQKTKTLGAALEALGGVWESAVGSFGSAFAEDIKAFANIAQRFIENTLTPWIEQNKGLIKTVVGVVGGFLAGKIAILGMGYAVNLFLSPFKTFAVLGRQVNAAFNIMRLARFGGAARSINLMGKIASGAGKAFSLFGRALFTFGRTIGGGVVKSLMVAGKAFMWLGRAMLMNPIGLVITGLAIGAYYIWQNWAKLKPLFTELWQSITAKFDAAWTGIKSAWSGIGEWVSTAWAGVADFFSHLWTNITTFFSSGIGNISATILNWSPLGLFYQAFSGVMSWFGVDMPAKFTEFGGNIISGLVNGIKNAWENVKQSVQDLGGSITSWFKEKLGIHSPSRVFKGYGVNIVEGLVVGMENKQSLASQATGELGQAVSVAFQSAKSGWFDDLWTTVSQFGTGIRQFFALSEVGDRAMHHPTFNPTTPNDGGFADYPPLNRDVPSRQNTGAITVHFSPTVHIQGQQTPQSVGLKEQIIQALRDPSMLYEIERVMRQATDQYQRRAY